MGNIHYGTMRRISVGLRVKFRLHSHERRTKRYLRRSNGDAAKVTTAGTSGRAEWQFVGVEGNRPLSPEEEQNVQTMPYVLPAATGIYRVQKRARGG